MARAKLNIRAIGNASLTGQLRRHFEERILSNLCATLHLIRHIADFEMLQHSPVIQVQIELVVFDLTRLDPLQRIELRLAIRERKLLLKQQLGNAREDEAQRSCLVHHFRRVFIVPVRP